MTTQELFSEGMFFKTARSLIPIIPILFIKNFDHIFKITFRSRETYGIFDKLSLTLFIDK